MVLEPRVSPEHASKYVDTVTVFIKTWTNGHWPLDDLWPHICWGLYVWLYPRIIVYKSHENTSKYVDTVTFFAKTWSEGHWPLDDLWPHVEVTCVTLPKDHCVQVPWKYIKVCGYSDPFCKNLNQRSMTPIWPLTPHLLRSHVWLYPRIIVSKSHGNTSMYADTVINFTKITTYIHIHTYIHILHTTYRISDHIVSFWTTFRRDKNTHPQTPHTHPHLHTDTPHTPPHPRTHPDSHTHCIACTKYVNIL